MSHPLVVNIYHRVPYDVYCGRGELPAGKWGNPFMINEDIGYMREDAIADHHHWLLHHSDLKHDLHELTGKRLGCYCAPRPCHCDTLARMANNPFVLNAFCKER